MKTSLRSQRVAGALLVLSLCLRAIAAAPAPGISHAPRQPKSGQEVTITAPLEHAGETAILHVQVVEPGHYLRKTDPGYSNDWKAFPMSPAARRANTVEFTVPSAMQQHRRLVRYYVSITGTDGSARRLPAITNECPNFAYFVYDGLPAWTGASEPGRTPPLSFRAEFMATMPAYHLLARRENVEQSQWDGGANKKRFHGTLVYDGHVYDHIQFQNRGKASTYVSGKNKWAFKFNDSEPFHDRDLFGELATNTVKSISLTACASPWAQVNRGMAGMDEAVSFRAYQLAGVPAADTHWIQLRVIAGMDEAPSGNQYDGDLWGLYQVVQEPGGEWLRSHGLPQGEIYSPETGIKHRPKGAPTNDAPYHYFMSGPHGPDAEAWWRTNLDLPRYYSFHALNRVLSNVDVRPGANYYLWHEPDGRWCVIPWDLDMMFIAKTHQPGFVEATRCLDVPALRREYQARAREILDLFCADGSPRGGQIGQLVAELARGLVPPGHQRTWPELDMCVWNHHPRSNARGQFYVTPCRDGRFGGEWTRILDSPDFAGFCRYIVDFCTDSRPAHSYAINDGDQRGYGFGYLSIEARDDLVPLRPTIRRGHGDGYEVSAFQAAPKATNSAFGTLQWRLGEIGTSAATGKARPQYELHELWSQLQQNSEAREIRTPPPVRSGHHYRLRARYQDSTGRWSHWSEPVEVEK